MRTCCETYAAWDSPVLQVRVDDPRDLDPASVEALRLLFEEHGIVMGQTVGNYGGGLVADDIQERTAAIEFMKRMCGATAALGRAGYVLEARQPEPRQPVVSAPPEPITAGVRPANRFRTADLRNGRE